MSNGKIFFGSIILALGGSTLSQTTQANRLPVKDDQSIMSPDLQKKAVKESPFACNMLALDVEERRRHFEVIGKLRGAIKDTQELSDGYALRFPSDKSTLLLAAEFISRERLCCSFFDFELVVEREDGPLWLRLRGREGVKDFIRVEFGMK